MRPADARLSTFGDPAATVRNGYAYLPEDYRLTPAGLTVDEQEPQAPSLSELKSGALAPYLDRGTILTIGGPDARSDHEAGFDVVLSSYGLQDIADYRAALQQWFDLVASGGHLVVVVPHAFLFDRQLALPSPLRAQSRRLYTPASLLDEIEEALVPNSYRVRWLGDLDGGYDYAVDRSVPPVGAHSIALAIEKIASPAWGLEPRTNSVQPAPDYAFEPGRTRVERAAIAGHHRILVLKLDHLGDFIMGIAALQRLRATFPESLITLVVGSWNEAMARELGIADRVLAFDVYPRNSSEEKVDVRGKTALFDQLVDDEYDLAIDLRTDPDTRFLLRNVRSRVRAGMGTRAEFDFLDIFLPIDISRHEPETAKEEVIGHGAFSCQPFCRRSEFHIAFASEDVRRDSGALVWGPYWQLRPGRYTFEPKIELRDDQAGLMSVDVALDSKWQSFEMLPTATPMRLRFTVDRPGTRFESRIWAVDDQKPLDFRFYGGRLIRQGAHSVLHQSEYLILLIELVAMRSLRSGLLQEAGRIA